MNFNIILRYFNIFSNSFSKSTNKPNIINILPPTTRNVEGQPLDHEKVLIN